MSDELIKSVPLAGAALNAMTDLAVAAFSDRLTGLPNRAAFESLREGYDRDLSLRWAVVFVDLSGFKEINDARGHAAGDAALKLAGSMSGTVAQQHKGQAFRYGGDEFVILLKDDKVEEFIKIAEQQLTEMTLKLNGVSVIVAATLGYARGANNDTLEQLTSRADRACRMAKSREDGKALAWTAAIEDDALISERKKCSSCRATTTVQVFSSQQHAHFLRVCGNCGVSYSNA